MTRPASSLSGVPVSKVTDQNKNLVMSSLVGQGELVLKLLLVTPAKRATSNVTIPPNEVAVTIAALHPGGGSRLGDRWLAC